MSTPRSGRTALPAWSAPFLVILGVLAMVVGGAYLFRGLGTRTFLVGSEALLTVPVLLAFVAARIPLRRGLAFEPLPATALALSVGLGATLWAASLGLFELQYVFWAPPPGYLEGFQRLHDLLKASGPFDTLLSLCAIAFAPAACEELLFRGAVLPALVPRFGTVAAAIGSAALFGLIHVDFTSGSSSMYRVPFAFAVGLGLAALRIRTGSLWASILAHATLNGITYFAAPLAGTPDGTLPPAEPLLGSALFLGGLLTSALLFALLARSLTPPRSAA